MNQPKVLLVGWDAADWKVINGLMDDGRMPNVRRLVENGVMGNLATLHPILSPMLWTSIATGKRPFKHGIYGFSEPTPDGKSVQPMTNVSRKCKAVWNILNEHDKKSLVVGWWPSHPAEPIDGAMVSDFYCKVPRKPGQPWNLMKKAVHPERLFVELDELRVHPDHLRPDDILPFLPHGAEIDQETDSRVSSVMRTLCECTAIQSAATHLLQTEPWDFAAVYFDAIDHFCHGFMKYHPPRQDHVSEEDFRLYKDVVTTGYIYHDMMLGQLLRIVGDDVIVILMSDHGFHPDHLRPKQLPAEPAGPAAEHREFGIFVASGPGIKKDQLIHGASLLDITPTILTMYGLPVGADMDGKPLVDIFAQKPDIETIPSWEEVVGRDGQHPKNLKLDPAESAEAMEQLIALGYIERPDDNSEQAIADCVRELDYNLARSYMDAGMHGLATPLLLNLYRTYPLEFRYGVQLANCLKVMDRTIDLENLVNDLNNRWRVAAGEARKRLRDLAELSKERKEHWEELEKIDDANKDDPSNPPRLARVNIDGSPVLFTEAESLAIRRLRAIAVGNPQTLDFLSATIASSKGEFETALKYMESARMTKSRSAGFQFQLGNVYLALDRPQDAEAAFLKALEFDDLDSRSMMGLCRTWLLTGNVKKALEVGQQAIGLKYHAPVAHFFVGNAKKRLGNIEGAIQSYQTALSQNPNFVEAHGKLVEIYSASKFDKELVLKHRAAIRELENDQSDLAAETELLEFTPVEEIDFEELVPQIVAANNESFLRCLAQPKPIVNESDHSQTAADQPEIIIVSGLPRSGTSMMMQMLASGGLEIYFDGERNADESNPKGYFESERAKRLNQANDWLPDCQGKVLKVVAPLIPYLPQDFSYRVIMMQRDIVEIVNSQEKMLERLNRTGGDLEKQRLGEILAAQKLYAENLLQLHDIPILNISYSAAIKNPAAVAAELNEILDGKLSESRMAAEIDPALYREKKERISS